MSMLQCFWQDCLGKKVLIMNIVSALQDLGWQVRASFTGIPAFACWCSANIWFPAATLWRSEASGASAADKFFAYFGVRRQRHQFWNQQRQFFNPVSLVVAGLDTESQLAAKPLLGSENSWCDTKSISSWRELVHWQAFDEEIWSTLSMLYAATEL